MPDWKARVTAAFARRNVSPDADVVDELAQHAAAAFEAARADGTADAAASERVDELIARWTLDPAVAGRRPKRPAAVPPPMPSASVWSGLGQDIRYGVRLLRRQPGYAFVTVLTMALGIGASTTLFSVAYGVLLKPLPWAEADRLVRITETRKGHDPRVRGTMSNGPYLTWAAAHSTIESLGGWINTRPSLLAIDGGEPLELQAVSVTPSLFTVLKARPLLGRPFVDDDVIAGAPGATRVVILSYGVWQDRFAGAESAVGRSIRLNDKPVTVIGIMPKDFAFPDRETRAWTPWSPPPVNGQGGVLQMTIFSVLARLRPGATADQATAEGTARALGAPDPGMTAVAMFGGSGAAEIRAIPAVDQMTADVRPALVVLLAAVALLLVTATANVASLQLARAATRRREMAIRAAIGAGGGRLTRQLIVENGLTGIAGGAAGVALALALHRALPALLPADFPRVDAIAVDWRVLLFAAAVSMGASIVCGLAPARQARRIDLVESLSEDGSAPVGHGVRCGTARARTLIMAGQIAVSCVLLIGAALLARSFLALLHADRGYDPANVLTARVSFPNDYTMERRMAFLERFAERLRAIPGVRESAYGNALPLLTSGGFHAFKMRSPADPSVEVDVNVMQRAVSPDYFSALGLRLVAGRSLTPLDTMTAPNVILVNRSFAAKYLGAQPLGVSIANLGMCRGNNDRWEVVGVVDDMRQGAVSDPRQPELFLPVRQIGCTGALQTAIFLTRTAGDPLPLASTLRGFIRDQEPSLVVDSVMTMEDRVMRTLAKPRLYAVVLAGFGLFAVVIAGVGVFGVLSYSVAQRAREIGVRTALGARPSNIVGLVVRQVALVAVAGIGCGLAVALAATQSLSAVLYGVAPHDPISFAVVPAVLIAVAAIASIVPARRAARVDPLKVLR
jgi:predicted permease